MSSDKIHADALMCLGDLHFKGRDPVAELAYYRCLERRLREGKATRVRLR